MTEGSTRLSMRVAEIVAYRVRVPLRKVVRHASSARDVSENLIVCCRLEDGTRGWGESVPRPYVTGETAETAMELLAASDPAGQLGERCASFEDALQLADSLRIDAAATPPNSPLVRRPTAGSATRASTKPKHRRGHPPPPTSAPAAGAGAPASGPVLSSSSGVAARDCFGNAAQCALELAVLDAFGRAFGQPLSAVTSILPEAESLVQSADRVRYSGVITAESPWKERFSAWKMRLNRFAHVKVKVGIAGQDDAARLRRIRRIVGRNVDLRVDANEAWTPDEAPRRIKALAGFNISGVEQPLPHERFDELPALRKAVSVPIMLDESLASVSDARRAIEAGACDLFNIRLSKCGGFVSSLRIAALAGEHAIGCQLGCQVGETGILSAAGRHFAASVAGLRYLEGSFDRYLVRERLTCEDLTFGFGGWAPALEGPGLGVEVDAERVKRIALAQQRWTAQ